MSLIKRLEELIIANKRKGEFFVGKELQILQPSLKFHETLQDLHRQFKGASLFMPFGSTRPSAGDNGIHSLSVMGVTIRIIQAFVPEEIVSVITPAQTLTIVGNNTSASHERD